MSILVLTSDTLSSPAAVGQIEYSSPIYAATPIGTQRGIVPTQQYYRLNADIAGANVTTAQSIFGVGVTLSASTVYEFEIVVAFTKTAGTTSHSCGVGFGGTATINNISYNCLSYLNLTQFTAAGTGAGTNIGNISAASNTTVTQATTSATVYWSVTSKGTVSINAGGTFIPQYTLSAAAGGAYSTVAGSFIRINPLSASGAATNVGTWA
jgi:hypothetical protein